MLCMFVYIPLFLPALFQDVGDIESTLNILNVLDELLSAGESLRELSHKSKKRKTKKKRRRRKKGDNKRMK